jgi:hypothetical protein
MLFQKYKFHELKNTFLDAFFSIISNLDTFLYPGQKT